MTGAIKCLLWDFGDTLCDETFIWGSGPEWMDVYRTFDEGWASAWNIGEMSTRDFAEELAKRMTLTPEAVIEHMTRRCREIRFFEFTYAFFKARHLPQAIVTVNPDFFSEVIVPLCALDEPTSAIVTSWEERTVDKGALCAIALERMNLGCEPSEALLIDNKQANVDAWIARDGVGYVYTTDDDFRRDAARGIDHLHGTHP